MTEIKIDKNSGKVIPINADTAKNLSDYIEKSWDLANNSDAVSNELWSSELQAFLDGYTLKSLFFSEDWVFIIVDLIANKISSQPFCVMRYESVDGEESKEKAYDHPLNELIEQPNQWQDYAQFMYNVCVELFLMGNAIIWKAPRSGQLITLPTENVTINFNSDGSLKEYVVSNIREDDTGFRELIASQIFAPDEIIHIRRSNPSSMLWGLSPFIPGRKSILFNRYSSDYLNAFYLKQATPGLALSLDRNVNEDVALRQLRSFEMAYQGRKNARRTMILPKGVDAKTLTHSLSDQKLIEHIELNRETICGLLKVPKHELSLQEAGSLGSEEYKISLRNFWESTLIPGTHLIEGMFNKVFSKELGEDHFLEFDLTGVEALKDDLKKKAEMASQMLQSGLSVNEVRQSIWMEEASDDPMANTPYILLGQRNIVVEGSGSQGDVVAEDSDRESVGIDAESQLVLSNRPATKIKIGEKLSGLRNIHLKQLQDEESRTISALSNLTIDTLVSMTERALEVIEKSDKQSLIKDRKELARYSDIDFKPPQGVADAARRGLELRDEYGRGGTATGIARARDLANRKTISSDTIRRMVSFFARHEDNKDTPPEEGNGMIAWLLWGGDPGRTWSEKVSRQMQRADENEKCILVKDLPSSRTLARRINRALKSEFEESWLDEYTRSLTASIDVGYNQELSLIFNGEARREIAALKERDEEKRRLTLQARAIDAFEGITETHTERIMKEIERGQARNESITDIMRRVAESLGTPGQLAGKAETIARTETLTAVSIGQGAATENAKEVIPGLKKVWLTAGDDRVRDSHEALDGDIVDVDAKFDNGLRYPRDVESGQASEIINCRCTMLLVPPDENIDLET